MSSRGPPPSLSDNQSHMSGSKFRKLLPAPASKSKGTSSNSSRVPSLQPRLLPRTNLTRIACEPCRKRKSKCCGERPKCKACINRGLECHYQASYQDLLDLMRKHDEIQEKASIYERIYNLLINLPEQDSHAVLNRLRASPDVATTILRVALAPGTKLCEGQAVENLSDWLPGALSSGSGGLSAVGTPVSYNASLGGTSASTPAGGVSGNASYFLSIETKNVTSSNPDEMVSSISDDCQGRRSFRLPHGPTVC
ncbi:hypothetical protein FOVG_16291 [Fusarium oxysporum f. sp. pisi HDV247]|uniref:Zn(2)-C6 fungal-type domain-containing protein n=1 Tax=Fusarium oxysporum f. sp. pisi HDV247 TaxID=1080344 RepID=W9NP03_FUSOX|nr:hypothetical protein FOVG_16291 [Fusarium oxysporum f. sp. pisi HDV247]